MPAHGRLEEVIGVHARVPGTRQGKRLPGGGILALVCDLPVTLWALVRECLSPQWFFSFFRGKKKILLINKKTALLQKNGGRATLGVPRFPVKNPGKKGF